MAHGALLTLASLTGLLVSLVTGCSGNVEQTAQAPVGEGTRRPDTESPGDGDGARSGDGGGKSGSPGPAGAQCTSATLDVGATPLRRLSNLELQLTLQDLFQLPEPPSLEGIPLDNDKDGFKTIADAQSISAQHLRAYSDKARELADVLLSDATRRRRVVGCEPSASGCLRSFIASFGRLAYRRPLAADEIERLSARATEFGLDGNDQVRYAIQALLTSMSFLYRIESGTEQAASRLTADELATRLSFALWGRGPSAELLDQARAGMLDSEQGLEQVATKMAGHPRTETYALAFFRQWLGYDTLHAPMVKPAGWSDGLLVDMQKETDQLVQKHAFGEGSLLAALTSNETYLTPELARFYGLPTAASGAVAIPASHPRANTGLIGHASLMSAKTDGDLIAIRGNWLRRTFLCREMHIPPAVADELGELLVGLNRVQIVQKRTSEPSCRGCHNIIDPIGVGLLKFDRAGRWDESVDTSAYGLTPSLADVDDPNFDRVSELSQKLRDAPEVASCIAEKLFVYMNGRSPAEQDACALERASSRFASSGHHFRELAIALVTNPAFRVRRAPVLSGAAP
jgi:hypothetical protein